jgi:hypothetical protein
MRASTGKAVLPMAAPKKSTNGNRGAPAPSREKSAWAKIGPQTNGAMRLAWLGEEGGFGGTAQNTGVHFEADQEHEQDQAQWAESV